MSERSNATVLRTLTTPPAHALAAILARVRVPASHPPTCHEHHACRYNFPSPEWDTISAGAKDLVSKLLTTDTEERLAANEVADHPWIVAAVGATSPEYSEPLNLAQDGLERIQSSKSVKKLNSGVNA